ncbi:MULTISPECIES: hypothetical protein [Mycobacteriaceae]|uniref:hypothetical protein n=1 Tax=Mycobacteriaceae TaxID=1762 RepID=UPI001CD9E848|nr:hypothetical protein [Mycobacterium sp. WUMAC-067]MCA2243352.1 hypothetical protein [Mycobacterium sp. WUMAC-067]
MIETVIDYLAFGLILAFGHIVRVTIPALGYLLLARWIVNKTGTTNGIPAIGRQVAAIVAHGGRRDRHLARRNNRDIS